MDGNKLSYRLQKVAEYVPADSRLADIGSDHAYLPAYLALKGKINFGIAGEVVKGPFQNAQNEIKKENLQEIIDVRLTDGLAAVELSDEINVVTICGMGGPLICQILEEGKAKLANHPRLVLQPNVGEKNVREWLVANNYQIIAEDILEEDKHIYEIIVAEFVDVKAELTAKELEFGPYLMKEKNEVFKHKWQKELDKIETVRVQLEKAKEKPVAKLEYLDEQVKLIEGVLND